MKDYGKANDTQLAQPKAYSTWIPDAGPAFGTVGPDSKELPVFC